MASVLRAAVLGRTGAAGGWTAEALVDWREILRIRKKLDWRLRALPGAALAIRRAGDPQVDFAIADDERTFRQEIRDFLAAELTPEAVREAQSEERISRAGRDFIRKLGQ